MLLKNKLFLLLVSCSFLISSCAKKEGCKDPEAINYDESAKREDGSCKYKEGCTDPNASNYDPTAKVDNGSCTYPFSKALTMTITGASAFDHDFAGFTTTNNGSNYLISGTNSTFNFELFLPLSLTEGQTYYLPYTKGSLTRVSDYVVYKSEYCNGFYFTVTSLNNKNLAGTFAGEFNREPGCTGGYFTVSNGNLSTILP